MIAWAYWYTRKTQLRQKFLCVLCVRLRFFLSR